MGEKSRRNKTKVTRRGGSCILPRHINLNPSQCHNSNADNNMHLDFTIPSPPPPPLITTLPVISRNDQDLVEAPKGATCWICLEWAEDNNEEPLWCNYASCGDSGYTRLTSLVSMAKSASEEIWMHKKKPVILPLPLYTSFCSCFGNTKFPSNNPHRQEKSLSKHQWADIW